MCWVCEVCCHNLRMSECSHCMSIVERTDPSCMRLSLLSSFKVILLLWCHGDICTCVGDIVMYAYLVFPSLILKAIFLPSVFNAESISFKVWIFLVTQHQHQHKFVWICKHSFFYSAHMNNDLNNVVDSVSSSCTPVDVWKGMPLFAMSTSKSIII